MVKKPLFYLMGPVGADDNFYTSFVGIVLRYNKRQKQNIYAVLTAGIKFRTLACLHQEHYV